MQQRLQAFGKLLRVARAVRIAPQAVDGAIEALEITGMLACLERVHGKRQCVGAMTFELVEVGEPRIDLAIGEQRVTEMLVGCDVPAIDREDMAKRRRGGAPVALLREDDTKVEVGIDETGIERQCALVGARRTRHVPRPLERGAVIEVRERIGWRAQQDGVVDRERAGGVAAARVHPRLHAQQRRFERSQAQARVDEAHRIVVAPLGEGEIGCGKPRVDETGLRVERPGKRRGSLRGVLLRRRDDAGKVQGWRELGLFGDDRGVGCSRGGQVALPVQRDRVIPRLREFVGRGRRRRRRVGRRVQRAQRLRKRRGVERFLHDRRTVRRHADRHRPYVSCRPGKEHGGDVLRETDAVDEHVTVARSDRLGGSVVGGLGNARKHGMRHRNAGQGVAGQVRVAAAQDDERDGNVLQRRHRLAQRRARTRPRRACGCGQHPGQTQRTTPRAPWPDERDGRPRQCRRQRAVRIGEPRHELATRDAEGHRDLAQRTTIVERERTGGKLIGNPCAVAHECRDEGGRQRVNDGGERVDERFRVGR